MERLPFTARLETLLDSVALVISFGECVGLFLQVDEGILSESKEEQASFPAVVRRKVCCIQRLE